MRPSHFISLLLFSIPVSFVFAFLQRSEPQARLQYGLKVFAAFVGSTFVIGWLMAQFPR
jgi:hypothetical protein